MKHLLTLFFSLVCLACASLDEPQSAPLVADSGFAAPPLAGCKTDLRYLNPIGGWQAAWPRQWQRYVATHAAGADPHVWSQAPQAIELLTTRLQAGIANDETAPRRVVARVLQQTQALAQTLTRTESAYRFTEPRDDAQRGWNEFVEHELADAAARFAQFLEVVYLPAARLNDGLFDIEDGERCFASAVLWWNTISPSALELETLGARILAQTRQALLATGNPGETVDDILQRLRSSQANRTTTPEELIGLSEAALERARTKVPEAFGQKIVGALEVEVMAGHLQASSPAGRYQINTGDGPSKYIINPSRASERRLMAEVIAFHEGLPGHHLFFHYPTDGRETQSNSGMGEGWAIYAEYLADELGLYSSRLDRQGMMAKHLWAASRLLIEPGLHLRGWTREQAIDFMLTNTTLSRTEVAIEIDRYIAMPGQSLSYMLGAQMILAERASAEARLGDQFELAEFHHVVLAPGMRSLPALRRDIRDWVERSK